VYPAGWYTLRHTFSDDNGVVAGKLELVDAAGNVLWGKTLEDPADTIADVVGGSRYGWFAALNVPEGLKVGGTRVERGTNPLSGSVLANDVFPSDSQLTVALGHGPDNAAEFWLNPNGTFVYVPKKDFSGVDTFTYSFSDGYDDVSNVATVSITVVGPPAPEVTGGTLAGAVVFDANQSGVADPGERGVAGLTVFADLNDNGILDAGEASAVTDAQGRYVLEGLTSGQTYTVRLLPHSDFAPTGPTGVVATAAPDGAGPTFTGIPFLDTAPVFVSMAPVPGDTNGNQAYVLGLYHDLLGRDGSTDEGVNVWAGQLDGGASRSQVVRGIISSAEYRGRVVDHFYQALLGREADEAGRAGHLAFLMNGGTEEELAVKFLTSGEYQAKYPDNASFVASLYDRLLCRGVSEAEVAGWMNMLGAGISRADVVRGFLNSAEASMRALDGFYAAFLRRTADSSGQGSFGGMMQQSTGNAIDAMLAILASEEYRGRFGA